MKKSLAYAFTLSAAITVALAGCAPVAGAYSAPSGQPSASSAAGSSGRYSTSAGSGGSGTAAPLSAGVTALGSVLVDGTKTLYTFDADKPNSMKSSCAGDCLNDWPPVLVTGAVPKVMGVTGTLGTISAAGGAKQLTIDGRPLYTFSGDRAAGDVKGQGVNEFGGLWWAVAPSGSKITGH
jgi:predicted lipoprotein with Yx(FWY)xxD motif